MLVESLAQSFADGEEEKCKRQYFHSHPSHVDDMVWSIAAIPFTVLLSFQDSQSIEAHMRKVDVTFHFVAQVSVTIVLRLKTHIFASSPDHRKID